MSEKTILNPNLCRICLRKSPNCVSLFETCAIDEKTAIINLIQISVSIQLTTTENYPMNICNNCVNRLAVCYQFYSQCKLSEQTLQQQLSLNEVEDTKTVVKTEAIQFVEVKQEQQSNEDQRHDKTRSFKRGNSFVFNEGGTSDTQITSKNDTCNTVQSTSNKIRKYERKTTKKGEMRLQCSFCPHTLKNFHVLKIHMKASHQMYLCPNCYEIFQSWPDVLEHKRSKHPFRKNDPNYETVCKFCSKKFRKCFELKRHLRMHLAQITDPPSEEPNPKPDGVDDKLTIVKKRRHRSPQVGRQCNRCCLCAKQCTSIKAFRAHVQTDHVDSDGLLSCNKCEFRIDKYQTLYLHVQNKHEQSEHLCTHCGKTLIGWSSWNQHIKRVHLKRFEHSCDKCEKRFLFPHELRTHLAMMHSSERNVSCDICGKTFALQRQLTIHLRTHVQNRDFKCGVCARDFTTPENLQRHTKTHDEKKFQCQFCDKAFSIKKYLVVHMRVHTGELPYKCSVCEQAYPQWTSLNFHMKRHHTNFVGAIRKTKDIVVKAE